MLNETCTVLFVASNRLHIVPSHTRRSSGPTGTKKPSLYILHKKAYKVVTRGKLMASRERGKRVNFSGTERKERNKWYTNRQTKGVKGKLRLWSEIFALVFLMFPHWQTQLLTKHCCYVYEKCIRSRFRRIEMKTRKNCGKFGFWGQVSERGWHRIDWISDT